MYICSQYVEQGLVEVNQHYAFAPPPSLGLQPPISLFPPFSRYGNGRPPPPGTVKKPLICAMGMSCASDFKMASGPVPCPPAGADPSGPPTEEQAAPPQFPFTVRYGIKPAKRVIDNNAGSILADPDPPVVLSSAEEHRLRTAFSNNAPSDPTGGGKLNREGIRAVLKELGVPGISDDLLLAR